MSREKFRVLAIGDLTEEEAREYVYGDKGTWHGIINDPSALVPVPPGAEEQWPAIYERCGGNIGLLERCVSEARIHENWDDALDGLVTDPLSTVTNAYHPKSIAKLDEPPLWSKDEWETALHCITTAPHHAVLRSEMEKALGTLLIDGEITGAEVLLSMVKYNLLTVRPYSTLARDLPREVYGEDKGEVVTLPSPAHVSAAKLLFKRRVVGKPKLI